MQTRPKHYYTRLQLPKQLVRLRCVCSPNSLLFCCAVIFFSFRLLSTHFRAQPELYLGFKLSIIQPHPLSSSDHVSDEAPT
jgi:hypothetical protein